MASFAFTNFKRGLMAGEFDLDATDDIRVVLCMTNNTVEVEEDEVLMNGFSGAGLDEMDGAGYSRQALAAEAVVADNANDRGEFDATDITFAALGVGTRDVAGAIIYKHVTNDADSIPLIWIDFSPDYSANGSDLAIQWNAEGILQLT